MMDKIFHYLVLVFAVGIFSLVYFKLLRFSLDKVVMKEKPFSFLYISFFIRIILTVCFFYILLKYYHDIQEMLIAVVIFVICRYLILRKDKMVIKKVKSK